MFSIDWLNGAALIETEATELTNVQCVVEFARTHAMKVRQRHPGAEPTSFQVCDDTRGFVAVYMIEGGPGRSGVSH